MVLMEWAAEMLREVVGPLVSVVVRPEEISSEVLVPVAGGGAAVSISGGTRTAASPARPGSACQPTATASSAAPASTVRRDRTGLEPVLGLGLGLGVEVWLEVFMMSGDAG